MKAIGFILLWCLPQIIFAQKLKIKTTYQAYATTEKLNKTRIDQIEYYNTNGLVERLEVFGMENNEVEKTDTMIISNMQGSDSMIVTRRANLDYSKIGTYAMMEYNANKKINRNTVVNYKIENQKMDSSISIITYQYLSKNIVIKTTLDNGNQIAKQEFIEDANGIKIYPRYAYKLDKQNRLVEKKLRSETKKIARVEKYTYNSNGKIKEWKVLVGGKPKSITSYAYDADWHLLAETTKNLQGKTATYDLIEYEYQNGLCTKETTSTAGEQSTVVEYAYIFYP